MGAIMAKKNQNGAAVVEFAVILPLLLLLVFGIIEFGVLIYNKAMITNASREGARLGIVFRTNRGTVEAEVRDRIDDYLNNYLINFGGNTDHTVSFDPIDPSVISTGQTLEVTVTYPYNFLIVPNFITNLSGGVTLQARTTMRAE